MRSFSNSKEEKKLFYQFVISFEEQIRKYFHQSNSFCFISWLMTLISWTWSIWWCRLTICWCRLTIWWYRWRILLNTVLLSSVSRCSRSIYTKLKNCLSCICNKSSKAKKLEKKKNVYISRFFNLFLINSLPLHLRKFQPCLQLLL
jgi:hypothetical protein